ncbi:MAG TPA: LiaF domain-containing protein [Propionibacteriaceae bacterium]|nr:LiaF domain-containing protein [Propionibacteriaceae bacterium]
MTALNEAVRSDPDGHAARRPYLRLDRIACGILLVAVGTGWLLDRFGVPVPWRLGAPVALTLVGATLSIAVLATRDGGMRVGRSGLAWLGAALLALSVALGVSASQYVAPAGNVSIAPAATDWPVEIRRSVGNIDLDFTRHPLPDRGTASVHLGAGSITVTVPRGSTMRIDVRATTGQIRVDGETVSSGADLRWSESSSTTLVTTVQLAAGEVDIRHE